ncbi:MAG: alpha-2-macroglobulin [Dehalococcoidia bacterium]|nr:alpha-2-macroglobulin [Dehalococcoidia bacterium]
MARKSTVWFAFFLIPILLVSMMPGCARNAQAATGYIAVIPSVLHSGGQEAIAFTLFDGDELVRDRIEVSVFKDGKRIARTVRWIDGKGTVLVDLPEVEQGEYEVRVKGSGFQDAAPVRIEKNFLIFLETDKPIYKPGQTVCIRAVTVDADLRPVSEPFVLEVMDAKGIKIMRAELSTDRFGMSTFKLPLSAEPNLGVWKIKATSGKGNAQLDVRIEEYVLPKYDVKVDLLKEWCLVTETVKGSVTSEYSFGKPVKGELVVKASRYVGEWEQYAIFTGEIDGQAEFEIPAVRYVTGVPSAGGLGNIMLEVTVKESATGYEQTTTKLLTVAGSSLNVQVIPESQIFKPGLPFSFLLVTTTPDNSPVDRTVNVDIRYLGEDFGEAGREEKTIQTVNGKSYVEITPPAKAVAMIIEANSGDTWSSRVVEAGYSPSGNFIHLEQLTSGIPQIGDKLEFKVHSTKEAVNFYFEVVSRNKVIFSSHSKSNLISFTATPQMAPSARLLVYQVLPNSEVAADYLPFKVEATYPHNFSVEFDRDEARPGETVDLEIQTEGESKVGLVAVDKSVFILAENRLNLQQVFEELERLYMQPQAELHDFSIYNGFEQSGAKEIFDRAGVVVLSNNSIPEGIQHKPNEERPPFGGVLWKFFGRAAEMAADGAVQLPEGNAPPPSATGLAEVQQIRQYFPETWIWQEVVTDAGGKASMKVDVPDTITTWMLHAVAISSEKGLGIAETQLKAFQPFFLKADLPYSAIRGERFPVKVAVYNYLDEPQEVLVQLDAGGWFDLLDSASKSITVGANDVGAVEFTISPRTLGVQDIKVTARSAAAADAVIRKLIVEPEGISRELVENFVLTAGKTRTVDTSLPPFVVDGSGRVYIAVTSSYLTQTLDGLEALIQMPFGCGEQNMIVFAPDVYITRYLTETGQLKPEIMAKAEKLMITGYQRQLTYRHSDGSFSAFGESDPEGSLFLTAFVLKCFAQARDLMYIDAGILGEAERWITSHQNADGSFDTVGFVAHQELMGGLQGKTALTAFVATALLESGEETASARAVRYLEGRLGELNDAYTVAITAYALELAGSPLAADAHRILLEMAEEDENGMHWGDLLPRSQFEPNSSHAIEATGYALLAMLKHGDTAVASKAAKWLVSQRNAYGGFGSTQDTVIGLQGLTAYCTEARADVNLAVDIEWAGGSTRFALNQSNYDVLQVAAVPVDREITIRTTGKGEAVVQAVTRFNVPEPDTAGGFFTIDVDYDTTAVEVNDLVRVSVSVEFTPPLPMEAGMVVLDISVPTGFAAVNESINKVVEGNAKIKRVETAARKVIFYVENMLPGETISFGFDIQALYPVSAKGAGSQAYSYYSPELKAETIGKDIVVTGA